MTVRPSRRYLRHAALALSLGGALAGCTTPAGGSGMAGGDTAGSAGVQGNLPQSVIVRVPGHGWHPGGVDGPAPAPGTCRFGTVGGQPLPDRACTPGAVDTTVTQGNLARTLCRRGGYTDSVRPPREVTDAFKRVARAAYAAPGPSSDYELDHLVPLGLGGASDSRNLWPERNIGDPSQYDRSFTRGANAKDGVESRLHTAVCRGEVSLARAQAAVAVNWVTAESVLGVQP